MAIQDDINELRIRLEELEEKAKQESSTVSCRWYRKEDSGRAPGYELRLKSDQRYLGYFGTTKYGSEDLAYIAMLQTADAIDRALATS